MSANDQVRTHTDRAAAFVVQGELRAAAREFQSALVLAPHSATLRQRLGDVYARLGRTKEAIAEFQQVAGKFAADGQLFKAIAICKVVLKLDPQHTETQETLADLYAYHAAVSDLPGRLPDERLPDEPLPIVARLKLPASMSAAVLAPGAKTQPSEPVDIATLALFRKALGDARRADGPQSFDQLTTIPERAAPASPAIGHEHPAVQAAALASAAASPGPGLDLSPLAPSPLFSALDADAFQAVIARLEMRSMTAGEALIVEGKPGESMFVIVQGVVDVVRNGADSSRVVAVMGEGSFFGEMALISNAPRIANVLAKTDGLLFEISRAALEDLELRHPSIRRVIEEFYRERLLRNLLWSSPIFRPFSVDEKGAIAARFERHSVPPRTLLLEQGKRGSGLGVLLRGRANVFHLNAKGEELPLPGLQEGDIFGEISLLLDGPCTASVRSATYAEVLELPADAFRQLVMPNLEVRGMIQRVMTERLERSADLLDDKEILADYLV